MPPIPRRARPEELIPEEQAIASAIEAVRKLGEHLLLSETVIALGTAQRTLAQWHDSGRPTQVRS